jgi:MFS transporter, ACS family, tartrate transporter
MTDPANRIRNKLTWRLVAPLTFLIFLSSLDRVNVSFAALQMNRALGLTPEQYGFGVGLFFVGYLACQFPHTALLKRHGARRWIFGAVLLWGCIATLMAFMQDKLHFYALRVLLGAAESGFAPGTVYIMSQWMPQRFRAWAIAGSMLAIPISIVFGGPVSGLLLSAPPALAQEGWRLMFLVEGLVTIAAALLIPALFVNQLGEARWLSDGEKRWLQSEIERERAEAQPRDAGPRSFSGLFRSARVWACAGIWFSLMSGSYGIIYWLPQIIKQLSGLSDLEVSVLSALPWAALGAGMLLNAWHSDRTRERIWHVAGPALLAAAGIWLGSALGTNLAALICLSLGAFGLGAAQGAFWTLPTSFLDRELAASGITLINLIGSSGGLIAPPLIGFIRSRSGSFTLSVSVLTALLCLGAGLALLLRQRTAAEPSGRVAPRTG